MLNGDPYADEATRTCVLQNVRMPFILIGAHAWPLAVNCIVPDYLSGMQSVVEHLASSGRRRIGFVNGPPTTTSSEEKYRGLRLGLALRDLPFLQAVTVAGEFEAEAGYAATRDLLDRWTDLDAIAYASDSNALGGRRALAEAGRRVPDDIAVTGFYNYDVSRFTDPPLTTVHQDWVLAGELAARRLCMMMEDHDAQAWCVMIPTSLMVRDSSQVFGPRGQAVLTASSRVDRHSFYSLRREQNERQGTVTA